MPCVAIRNKMVTIVKHEWHQVDSQYAIELNENLVREIYPDMDDDEIATLMQELESGEADVGQVMSDAWENDVDVDWDHQYDDWWTSRKGGYEVTYEYGDEDSWHHEPEPDPPYYKCTKCRWDGNKWQGKTAYCREDGSIIPDDSDEESHHNKETCPMCDSDLKLTEFGEKEEKEYEERRKKWAEESKDEDEDEGIDEADMAQALEELKLEFEQLMSHTLRCTECDWTGKEEQCEKEGICPNCAAYTEPIEGHEN